jgi:hypothetical protein
VTSPILSNEGINVRGQVAVLLLIAVVLVSLGAVYFAFPMGNLETTVIDQNNFFSIVQISDTQYLAVNDSGLFSGLTHWIVATNQSFNLKMVIHTGDIVDSASDSAQWDRANASMSVLLDTGIPYCWDAGEHDTVLQGSAVSWMGNSYAAFNPQVMSAKSYWAGDMGDGRNTAVKFSFGKYDFLVINLEYHPSAAVLSWMTSLLNTYKSSNVIVATHSYLNSAGTYEPGNETELFNTLNQYPNVFLTLSGHYANGAFNGTTGKREEILFDRENADNEQGAATARIVTFNLNENTVFVNTFATYGTFGSLNDPADQFTFPINLQKAPVTQPPYYVIGIAVLAVCAVGWVTLFLEQRLKRQAPK